MNTVDVNIVERGDRNLVVAVFLQSDGAEGDLTNYTLIDPVADLGLKSSARLSLVQIDHAFNGFSSIIQFDSGSVDPLFRWVLAEHTSSPIDFSYMGALKDTSGLDGTGKLQITTDGFTSTSDFGAILFKLRMP